MNKAWVNFWFEILKINSLTWRLEKNPGIFENLRESVAIKEKFFQNMLKTEKLPLEKLLIG